MTATERKRARQAVHRTARALVQMQRDLRAAEDQVHSAQACLDIVRDFEWARELRPDADVQADYEALIRTGQGNRSVIQEWFIRRSQTPEVLRAERTRFTQQLEQARMRVAELQVALAGAGIKTE